jgi:hypothetical protein
MERKTPMTKPSLRISFLSVVAALLIAEMGTSCSSSRELTRSRAAQLIQKAQGFAEPYVAVIPPAGYVIDEMAFRLPVYSVLRGFESLGFVEFKWKRRDPVTGDWHATFLTPRGKDESKGWAPTAQGGWTVPLADRALVEVTGIATESQGNAEVEFTWKWIPNKMGDALSAIKRFPIDGEGTGTIHNAVATFRLFDDGWRLESISWR